MCFNINNVYEFPFREGSPDSLYALACVENMFQNNFPNDVNTFCFTII